jgi:outer membrane protein TolC
MKKMFLLVLVLICRIFISAEVQAETKTCEQPNSFQAIVNCAMENHPEIQRQESMQNIGLSLEKQAAQRLNPEIDDQSVFGNNQNQSVSSHQINLAHTFELGGKRPARMGAAKAEASNIVSQALHIKEEVFMRTVKTLYRIRQVHTEMKILNEALETFGKIQKQFKSRPRLGPEQEVSLSVFQLAQGDYQLRRMSCKLKNHSLKIPLSFP